MDRQQLLTNAEHHAEIAHGLLASAFANAHDVHKRDLANAHTALAAAWAQIAAATPADESGDPR